MENSIELIKAKLGVLELKRKQIEAKLVDKKSRKVKIDEIYELILKVQEEKLVAAESIEEVEL